MAEVTYSGYANRLGYRCLPGHKEEFEALAEELFAANAAIRYLAFHDPNGEYDTAVANRDRIKVQLAAISKPKRSSIKKEPVTER